MIKDNKTKTASVRLSEEDFKLFKIACYQSGTTPSKFLRMMINAAVNAVKIEIEKGVINLEDYKTVLDD